MKQIKLLLLILAMFVPMMVNADTVEIDGIYYNLISKLKQAEVTNNPNYYSGEVVIPETVTYESVEYSVTSIGEGSFSSCSSLTSVMIPNSVISIGGCAFYGCSELTSITIPNSVTSIGESVFSSCSSLTSVMIPNSVTSIGGHAFVGCNSLTSVTIPNSVTSIGEGAFQDCRGLTSMTIPNNVTFIGEDTFYGCSSLTSVMIPNSVILIGVNAFRECSSLTSVTIPCSVTSIGGRAFEECSNLTSVTIPSSVTSIGSYAFQNCSSLKSVTIPNGVTSIGDDTFYGCANLVTITLGKGISTIGFGAFSKCANLTDVYCYAENVPNTATNTFEDSYIEYATLHVPAGSKAVYEAADYWKEFKEIIEMEDPSVRTVNVATAGTLSDLMSNDDVDPLTITDLTITGQLNGTDLRLLREMAGNDYLGQPTSGNLKKLDISGANIVAGGEKYLDTDRITSSTGTYTQDNGENSFHYETENNVLGKSLFAGCDKLEEVILPNSLTAIGEYQFWYCLNLKSISIGKNVSSIGWQLVYGPNKLTNISVAEENATFSSPVNSNLLMQGTKVFFGFGNPTFPAGTTVIGTEAFSSCGSLGDITIPEGVTAIEAGAFAWSSLKSISFPSTLTTIENDAFAGCSGLTSFTLPKSVISYGDGSEGGLGALKDCVNLTSIKVEDGNTKYDSRDNCNAIIEKATNTLVSGCKNTVIPNTVTNIGHQAFRGMNLSDFEIPNWITTIGERAFWSSSLTSIKIPSSVSKIGELAFENCNNLISVSVEIKTPLVITGNTFTNRANASLYVPAGCKAAYEAADYWKEFGTIEEMPEPTTLTAKSYSRAYGEDNPTFDYDVTGGTITGTPEITCTATATSNVGTYDIVIAAGTITDPSVQYVNGTLTITKAPLKITAKSYTRKQGEANPDFGVTYEGFKNNETDAVLTTKPTVTCAATNDSPAGNYDITVSGAVAGNYEISYVAGTLTIETPPTPMPEPKGTIFDVDTDDSSSKEVKVTFVVKEIDSSGTPTVAVSDDKDASGSVSIPEAVTHNGVEYKVTEIGEGAFQNNTSLTEVKIPASITSIGAKAFAGCKNLQAITINIIVPINIAVISARGFTRTDDGDVFEGVDKETCILYVPEGSVDAYKAAPVWKEFKNILPIKTSTGINGIEQTDGEPFDVFTLSGQKVKSKATSLDGLPRGIYIVKGKKVIK